MWLFAGVFCLSLFAPLLLIPLAWPGPGGTGNKVKVSGMEVWTFSNNDHIQKSIGSFDVNEYNRQLKAGKP